MSTSLLYHGFGIQGYRYVRTHYEDGAIIFAIEQEQGELRCPQCCGAHVIRRGTCPRRFRTLPVGGKAVWLDVSVQRVECRGCGLVQQVELPFAEPRRSYTRAFQRYALGLCRVMTIQDVARHLGVSWDLIKDMHKRHLWQRYRRPSLRNLTSIAIDEICVGHGLRYLTIVLNLDTGAVIFVGHGKGKEALEPFWKRLGRRKKTIQAVAIDMSPAYLSAVL